MFPKKSVCAASRRGSFGIEDCSFRQRIFHMRSARPEYEVRVCKNSLWRQHVQNKRLFFLCKVIVLEVDGVQLLPQLRRISLGYSALGRISPCRYTGLWARLRNSVTPAIASNASDPGSGTPSVSGVAWPKVWLSVSNASALLEYTIRLNSVWVNPFVGK